MRFGHFDDERREYVITRPDTPLPWINYLGSEDYFALVSNTAGGYSFFRDARLRRLIRYRYNNAPLDVGGRFLYLRDDDTGDYWNPGWQPTQRDLDAYSLPARPRVHGHHGRARRHPRRDAPILVPPGETLEVWRTRVTNDRPDTARLSVFGAVEFCLWDAQDDATNFQRNLSTGEVHVEDGVDLPRDGVPRAPRPLRLVRVLGTGGRVRDVARGLPRALPGLGPAGRRGDRQDGRLRSPMAGSRSGRSRPTLVLGPGESRDVTFLVGYTENPADAKYDPPGSGRPDTTRARAVIDRYRDVGQVDEVLADPAGRLDGPARAPSR